MLAAAAYTLDAAELRALTLIRTTMMQLVFGSTDATRSLLATLASSLITLTSITFSVLLFAVQQAAATMTSQVIDQFLRRRLNQVFFGSFLGLALYCLVILSTVQEDFNPVISATIALILSGFTLYGLVLLIYVTVDQIRPANITQAIHDRTLRAREYQRNQLVDRTRREPRSLGRAPVEVRSTESGMLTFISPDILAEAVGAVPGGSAAGEIEVAESLGASVSYGGVIARVWPAAGSDTAAIESKVRAGLTIGNIRDLDRDPGYGVQQLTDIGWTTVSTSKHNPLPARRSVWALRDLLARWALEEPPESDPEQELPVVYRDNTVDELLSGLELLAVVTTESLQVQVFIEVLHTFTDVFDRLTPEQQNRSEDIILRSLSGMGDHVLTGPLAAELESLAAMLRDAGSAETAQSLDRAHTALAQSVGNLHSRSGRVPST